MSKQPESVADPLPVNLLAAPTTSRPSLRLVPSATARVSLRYACPDSRWRAMLVGLVCAFLLHAGLFYADRLGGKVLRLEVDPVGWTGGTGD